MNYRVLRQFSGAIGYGRWLLFFAIAGVCLGLSPLLLAHGVEEGDATFIEQTNGAQLLPFMYLGAKHMVTGYDHLLFLAGVIFFLYRMKEVGIYVTLFAVGHSVTLLYGVLSETNVNPYIVDAIIGFSVVYKALDNLGAFRRWFGFQPNTHAAVLIFGFFHGFGLATKLQDFTLSDNGLVPNMIAFNVGVEIGQLMALSVILIAMNFWRRTDVFPRQALAANVLLMSAGFMLMGYQLTGLYTVS
ncbi:HupE/UreJ family protein [Marinobacter caseinilyticus]|uniref:HupE/UreJ family protein n=1 Tax=Marinobacter caseinilyticus TaxID=2692195 RepID=UPI00140C782E|nr:HupE/UreJ family protein [Marinobacter caseinilyticus]